jgi:hypothetical protein
MIKNQRKVRSVPIIALHKSILSLLTESQPANSDSSGQSRSPSPVRPKTEVKILNKHR